MPMNDIDWTLVGRYAAGDCTDEERRQVERWLEEAPGHQAELRAIRRVTGQARLTLSEDERARLLAQVRSKIATAAVEPAPRTLWSRRFAVPMRIAAAVAVLVGGSLAGYLVLRGPAEPVAVTEPAARTIATTRGQRLALRLPDGSSVMLAPASTLRLAAGFGGRERVVELEGEAAFTVTHDESRPFTVLTSRGVARDLGTRFIVRAYPEDTAAEVVVAEGVVAVAAALAEVSAAAPLRADSVVLHPDERARVTPQGLATTSRVDAENYFAWTRGELRFERTPLRDAVPRLERWYDIDIHLATPALGARGLTASFRDEPASEAVRLIATALNLDVVRAGDRYTLRAN